MSVNHIVDNNEPYAMHISVAPSVDDFIVQRKNAVIIVDLNLNNESTSGFFNQKRRGSQKKLFGITANIDLVAVSSHEKTRKATTTATAFICGKTLH